MKKVFIDTNVVLDYYLDREGFSDDAEAILAYGYNQGCSFVCIFFNLCQYGVYRQKEVPW